MMKTKTYLLSLITIVTLIACANTPATLNDNQTSLPVSKNDTLISFDSEDSATSPKGFKGFNNCSQNINWQVIVDDSNKVVKQQSKNESSCYNVLMLDATAYLDFTASVKIKAVAGNEDQGGGLIWRCQNENNYYLARYNPLENNFRFYKVVNGNRKQLKSVESNIKSGEWFTMTIYMKGKNVSCSLNGNLLIQTTDETFPNAGRIGFWTKADAVTCFDELIIESSND